MFRVMFMFLTLGTISARTTPGIKGCSEHTTEWVDGWINACFLWWNTGEMSGKYLTLKSLGTGSYASLNPMFDSQNPYKKQAVVVHTCDPSIPTEGWRGDGDRIAWKLLGWLGRVCKRSCLSKVEGETRPPKLSSDLQIWVVVCMYPHVHVWEYMCLNTSMCA